MCMTVHMISSISLVIICDQIWENITCIFRFFAFKNFKSGRNIADLKFARMIEEWWLHVAMTLASFKFIMYHDQPYESLKLDV